MIKMNEDLREKECRSSCIMPESDSDLIGGDDSGVILSLINSLLNTF